MACLVHSTPDSKYYKRHYKGLIPPPAISGCELCFIYGVWNTYAAYIYPEAIQYEPPSHGPTIQIDGTPLDDRDDGTLRYNELGIDAELIKRYPQHDILPLMSSEGKPWGNVPYEFTLVGGQFGEAYQVLICQLLLYSYPIKVTYESCSENNQRWTQETKDLFKWYPTKPPSESDLIYRNAPKKTISCMIAAAFRAANKKDEPHRAQSKLFGLIRASLGLQLEGNVQPWPSKLPPDTPYLCPAYAAKYWLNRYFRLTKQFGKVKPEAQGQGGHSHREAKPEAQGQGGHSHNGMPKRDEVGMVAVIHVRRTLATGSDIGRIMDKINLDHVLESLRSANMLCLRLDVEEPGLAERFTHVILYGDFNHSEGEDMRKEAGESAEDQLQRAKDGNEEKDQRSRGSKHRGRSSFGANKNAVNASRWKRLKKRAGKESKRGSRKPDKFHVSFISRPWEHDSDNAKPSNSASPDSEVFEFWKSFRDFQSDKLPIQVKILGIWTALCERYGDKLCVIGHRSGFIEAAGLIGIPVFYLNNERNDMGLEPAQICRLLFDGSAVECPEDDRLRELADVMNTFIPVEALKPNAPKAVDGNEIMRVPNALKGELKKAIFMFMCCQLESNRPAWTDRVNLMHKPEGIEWLKQRYNYATHTRLTNSRT